MNSDGSPWNEDYVSRFNHSPEGNGKGNGISKFRCQSQVHGAVPRKSQFAKMQTKKEEDSEQDERIDQVKEDASFSDYNEENLERDEIDEVVT